MPKDDTMPNSYLHEVFEMTVKDLYSAENQLIEALPIMAEAAVSEELKDGFLLHLKQTQVHAHRLETIAEEHEIDIKGLLGGPKMKCMGMEGLIKEGNEAISHLEPSVALDLELIGAARKVEHYEMLGYEMAVRMAKEMGHENAADLLQQTHDEESETDTILLASSEAIFTENSQ